MHHRVSRSPVRTGPTPALRLALLFVVCCSLSGPAAERSLGARGETPRGAESAEARAAQDADRARAGGLQQIQPGHYVYLHTDDTPGVSSTFNSGIIVTSEGVVVIDANGSEEIAQGHRQILLDVREAVQAQVEQGATADQAVADVDLPQYQRFQGYSRAMEMAVRRAYEELTAGLD